jgi:hypothetical protein
VFEHLGSEQGFYTSMQLCSTFVRRSAVDLQLLSVFPRLEDEGVFYESRKWLKRDASDLSHDLPPILGIEYTDHPSTNFRSGMAALSASRSSRLSIIADVRTGSRLCLVLCLVPCLVPHREYEYGFAFKL